MKNYLAENLINLRKKSSLTQENLANELGVSFQAVSKWENSLTYPDISLLPTIAKLFNISIDSLLGYLPAQQKITDYEQRYKSENYYWGIEPSKMCYEVMKLKPPIQPYRLLDIGCGEGKDAVFFAKNGYIVSAFDVADSGIEKAKKLADINNVDVNFFKANINDYRLDNEFDIIFSSGVLHYMSHELRDSIIENYITHTTINGIHALNVFVDKPYVSLMSDHEIDEYRNIWSSGELFSLYKEWFFHTCSEVVFDCNSGGRAHKHCMDILIAEKLV